MTKGITENGGENYRLTSMCYGYDGIRHHRHNLNNIQEYEFKIQPFEHQSIHISDEYTGNFPFILYGPAGTYIGTD